MRFESGMLGFLIIVLAVGGAITGTILLSAEEQTQTVTKYNLVTDVTGLFDTDESPQYFDYDLSQNYTGYYTEDTVVNGVNYWGGATFTPAGVNNYPVRYMPTLQSTEDTYDLNNLNLTESTPPANDRNYLNFTMTYNKEANDNNEYNWGFYRAGSSTLQSLITELSLDDYEYIEIKSPSSDYEDRIYIGSIDDYSRKSDFVGGYYWEAPYQEEVTIQTSIPIGTCSCKINMMTEKVDLFTGTNAEMSTFYRTIDLAKATIIYEIPNQDAYHRGYDVLGDSATILAYNNGIVEYMDISKGVTVTGVTA